MHAQIEVTVDALVINEDDVDEQLKGLRDRFATLKTVERSALVGDFVQNAAVARVSLPQCGQTNPSGWRCRSSQTRLRLSSNKSASGKSIMPVVYHVVHDYWT